MKKKRSVKIQIAGYKWRKLQIFVAEEEQMLTAMRACSLLKNADPQMLLFYARYTDRDKTADFEPGSQPYPTRYCVEVQVFSDWPVYLLRRHFVRHMKPVEIRLLKAPSGSMVHALGFEIVHGIVNTKGDLRGLQDVVHWMYNMAGLNYGGEAACHLDLVLGYFWNSLKSPALLRHPNVVLQEEREKLLKAEREMEDAGLPVT